MNRASSHTTLILLALGSLLAEPSQTASAASHQRFTILDTNLENGETSFDGKLSLIIESTPIGEHYVFLRNNSGNPIQIAEYSLSPRLLGNCYGKDTTLSRFSTTELCVVNERPDESLRSTSALMNDGVATGQPRSQGHAALQLFIRWHRPIRGETGGTASASPLPGVPASKPAP